MSLLRSTASVTADLPECISDHPNETQLLMLQSASARLGGVKQLLARCSSQQHNVAPTICSMLQAGGNCQKQCLPLLGNRHAPSLDLKTLPTLQAVERRTPSRCRRPTLQNRGTTLQSTRCCHHISCHRGIQTETSNRAACTRSHRVPAKDQPRQ